MPCMEKMNAPVESHPGLDCAQMQKEGLHTAEAVADKMFKDLMKKSGAKECPRCHAFVSKTAGCNKMHCICDCLFCYVCGDDISNISGGGYDHFVDQDGPHALFFVPPDTGL